ncbi:MAG: pitrilysin family protein [Victivallaceae bacterium]|nr:pitrilysin family protein [Victivallaceae bacterium]
MTEPHSNPFRGDYFSRIHTFSLDNGLRLFVNTKPDAPTVSLHCFVATGSVHEAGFLGCGLAHFLEHMLFQGCDGYPGQAAADTVSRLGGSVNAYTSYDHTVYYLNLPSEHTETGIDILSRMLSSPEFPEAKFLSEKDVILRERDLGRDRPESMLGERLWKTVFLRHPVRHPIIGYHEKIEQVSRDLMCQYYEQRYSPERTFFVISGDIRVPAVLEMVEKRLASWRHGNIYEPPLPEEPPQIGFRSNNCFFADPLARLAVAARIPALAHPDIPALDLISAILGQGKSARLVRVLQQEKELAIAAGSFTYAPNFSGISAISAATAPAKLPALETALFEELEKFCRNGVTAGELEREKNQQLADYVRVLRSNNGIAGVIGDAVLAYGDPGMADHYLRRLNRVNRDDILEIANKYLTREQLSIVRQLPPEAGKNAAANRPKARRKPAHRSVLPSGARLITVPDSSFPLIDLCVLTLGGNLIETPENAGISRLTAQLLTTGTRSYGEEKFNALIDDNALDFSVNAGTSTFFIKLNCLRDKLDLALQLLKSVLAEPAFRPKQFVRERHNALEILKTKAQDPGSSAVDKMYELLYRGHPHALPRDGSLSSLAALTAGKLRKFYRRQFIAPRTVIGIAGDLEVKTAHRAAADLDAAIRWNDPATLKLPPAPAFPREDLRAEIELPRDQIKVIYAVPTCDYHSPDRFTFEILQQALNGLSSNLFKVIREDRGLAYSTGAMFGNGLYPGFIAFYAGTKRGSVPQVIELLTEERRRLAGTGLSQEEFDSARARVEFNYASLMSNNSALLFNSVLEEFYGNGCETPWRIPEIIRQLNLKQVNAVLKKYFTDAKGVYVTAGACKAATAP